MALVLDLTYSQANDATELTLTDAAGTYVEVDNETGWEAGGATNPDPADIVISTDTSTGSKYHLVLNVIVTNKYNVETTYDEIDLFAAAGLLEGQTFADASELTWDLTPANFDVSGTAMGASSDKFDDGIYDITYTLRDNTTPFAVVSTFNECIVVDGDVRIDVYNKLRLIPYDYTNEYIDTSRETMEALLAYSYLQAIEGSASVSLTEDLVNMLFTLDKLVSDGSTYTW